MCVKELSSPPRGLLYNLERSGLGDIDNIYYGSPRCDEMALVSHSPTDLQLMLALNEHGNSTSNPNKSHILIFRPSLLSVTMAEHFTGKRVVMLFQISETVKHDPFISLTNSTIERT